MNGLTEPIADDLEGIGYDAETHEPPKPSVPPARGTYPVRLLGYKEQTVFQGTDLKTPYELSINLEIVEPNPSAGRKAYFQVVKSKTFQSRNASQLSDLLAAISKALGVTEPIKGRDAIKRILDQARDSNVTFKSRWDWSAKDKAYLENIGAANMTSDDWNAYRIEGQKKFNADGTVVGPSGQTLTAQATVVGYIP